MNKLFASGLVAAAVLLSASAAQTLPIWSDLTQDSGVIAVADKCGIGRYRALNGKCYRKYYVGRGPKQFYSACGAVNSHRVCNFSGQCWMVCN
jgi:hypothetical protein